MGRQRGGVRALGPYRHGRQWRVYVVDHRGKKTSVFYATETEGRQVVRSLNREAGQAERTVDQALDGYEKYLGEGKGNKPNSVKETLRRLRLFFPDHEMSLVSLAADPGRCAGYYDALTRREKKDGTPVAVDTHRNILAEAKSFLRWCVVKMKWLPRNPLEHVEGKGKRRHGKAQLRIEESRAWLAKAIQLTRRVEREGPVAAMMSLLMNMRASEIVGRVVRDVDDHGRVLWIPDAKTPAGRRTLEVPTVLVPHLQKLASGRDGRELLFGRHWRDWVRKWVQRVCREAGVPVVTAHGMRGTHASLATERGATAHAVAAALGHESSRTTERSYTTPSALRAAKQERVLRVLQGGRR